MGLLTLEKGRGQAGGLGDLFSSLGETHSVSAPGGQGMEQRARTTYKALR